MSAVQERFGTGLLAQAAALAYHLIVVESLLLVTAGPGLAVLVLLDRDPSNLPLAALCALPAGPALSAALYTLHHRRLDLTDLRPASVFLHGYRLNARGALPVWAIWLTVLTLNLAHLGATGLAGPVLLMGVTLWMLNALVITSLFEFRTRDVVRLAAYTLVRTPPVTLANVCLVIVVLAGILIFSEAVLALAGSVLALVLLANSRKLIAVIRRDFTR
ncbi:hypothetical protein QLQ12_12485 [Actinoplanes sp. NEAU-A12]|uniref:DUF624 domain-containing protein n=1 Tax=Actinoplanes sandaracinus TaxID=3045177 RepID=A0ABT6WI53_9ACTN|nr:hypothetical protein [Actinoplanes sandaracinus]MDI6099411.1 hypothetical protein [Actinoplanes sandaracinus]